MLFIKPVYSLIIYPISENAWIVQEMFYGDTVNSFNVLRRTIARKVPNWIEYEEKKIATT